MRKLVISVLVLAAVTGAFVIWRGPDDVLDTASAMFRESNEAEKKPAPAPEESAAAPAEPEQESEAEANEVRLTPGQVKLIGLKTALVEKKPLTVDLSLNGEVVANQDRTVQVLPRAAGIVREVTKTLGDHVRVNDTLAVIESREIAEMIANLFAAKSKAELAQKQFEREASLFQKKVSAEQDYLTAKQSAASAAIDLRAAEQKLAFLGLDPKTIAEQPPGSRSASRAPVLAPLEGSIVEKRIAVGDQVTDQTPLFRIADLERVWVIADVFEKDIASVVLGQTATVTLRAYPDKSFAGKIVWISEVIDEATRTLKVRVELNNPERLLKPGSFARVTIKTAINGSGVAVPAAAIQRQKGEAIVFVEAGDGLYQRREVKLGVSGEEAIEVKSGLDVGEVVVTNGSFLLKSELEKSSFADSD